MSEKNILEQQVMNILILSYEVHASWDNFSHILVWDHERGSEFTLSMNRLKIWTTQIIIFGVHGPKQERSLIW